MSIALIDKNLDLAKSELLYDFKNFKAEEWDITRNPPKWVVTSDCIIGGRNDEDRHGQIFYHTPVKGEIVMEFDCATIAPSYHDLIWWFQTTLTPESWGEGYLGCLGGWFNNLAGIEKSPNFRPSVIAPSCPIEPGVEYHIVSGSVKGTAFIAVNGKLVFQFADPQPPSPEKPGYFGFGVYESHAYYRHLKVYRPFTTPIPLKYEVRH